MLFIISFILTSVLYSFITPTASAASPDLIISSLSASPPIIAPNDPLTISGRVTNKGNGDAGYFRTGMYLSKDPVITQDDGQIGSPKGVETDSLAAGSDDYFTYRTNLIALPAGLYYVGAIADYRNQVSEPDEANNALAGTRILIAKSEPIASGSRHALALRSDGSLLAWGDNTQGQLGDGTTVSKTSPVRLAVDKAWIALASGSNHSLALRSDGSLWAWGDNTKGQLGDGTTVNRASPVQLGKESTWTAIAAGSRHSLALRSDGTLWAWGDNTKGQLGDGTNKDRTVPTQVGKDATWVKVAAGSSHTLALQKNMTLWAWGNNASGQLGDNTREDKQSPTRIGMNSRWVGISAGAEHSVALYWCTDCWNSYQVWAWGRNGQGQLGDGTTSDRTSPVQVGTEATWTKVAAGSNHAIALKSDGTLWAWGSNNMGQLGDGTAGKRTAPVQVGKNAIWTSIAAGASHSMALKSDATLWVWGANDDGTPAEKRKAGAVVPEKITY